MRGRLYIPAFINTIPDSQENHTKEQLWRRHFDEDVRRHLLYGSYDMRSRMFLLKFFVYILNSKVFTANIEVRQCVR